MTFQIIRSQQNITWRLAHWNQLASQKVLKWDTTVLVGKEEIFKFFSWVFTKLESVLWLFLGFALPSDMIETQHHQFNFPNMEAVVWESLLSYCSSIFLAIFQDLLCWNWWIKQIQCGSIGNALHWISFSLPGRPLNSFLLYSRTSVFLHLLNMFVGLLYKLFLYHLRCFVSFRLDKVNHSTSIKTESKYSIVT